MRKLKALMILACLLSPTDQALLADSQPIAASIFNLLVHPEKYEDQKVQVVGYLTNGMLLLFPTKNLAEARDTMSSLAVSDTARGDITQSECPSSFVWMTGTFLKFDPGIYGLAHIENISKAKTDKVFWTKQAK